MSFIRAAGGLLWRRDRGGRRLLAVVHRPHRRDWSLPKGKLEPGESWDDAAVREVVEETGCTVRLGAFAGLIHYLHKGTLKIVLFWNMELRREGPLHDLDEVDRLAWLPPRAALRRLDHESERELLREVLARREQRPRRQRSRAPARRPRRSRAA